MGWAWPEKDDAHELLHSPGGVCCSLSYSCKNDSRINIDRHMRVHICANFTAQMPKEAFLHKLKSVGGPQ